MMASRGMGAIKPTKMPKKKVIRRTDNPDSVDMYAKGGRLVSGYGQAGQAGAAIAKKFMQKPGKVRAVDMLAEGGLYENIHKKRARIAAGSGEKMRKPGSPGAPTEEAFKKSARTAKKRQRMSTSGTSAFNLDLNDVIEEAFERCGRQLRSGYDFRTARRSLNLLTVEWANRGINLWTMVQGTIPMVTGQAIYPLPITTIDIMDAVIRQYPGLTLQTDINISRISESTYSTIPNKLTQGRPIQFWFNRQSGMDNPLPGITLQGGGLGLTETTVTLSSIPANLPSAGFIKIDAETISYAGVDPATNQLTNCARGQNGTAVNTHSAGSAVTQQNLPCLNIWPTPNPPGDQYTLVYWYLRRIQDAGNGVTFQDIPFRWIACLVAGLAYYLSIKLEGVSQERVMFLKADYEDQFGLASTEDRETAPVRFVPRNLFYYN